MALFLDKVRNLVAAYFFLFLACVALCRNECDRRTDLNVWPDLLEPFAQVVKGVSVRHVERKYQRVRTAVVGSGKRAESFLASRVPNLHLDNFSAVQF